MRTLLLKLMFLAGLWAAADVCAQEREAPEPGDVRAINPRAGGPQQRGVPPTTYQSRPGRHNDAAPRSRLFEDRQRNELQRQQPGQMRDPRSISYRTRPNPGEPTGAYVPRDMQRAIEQAQSEHGGKVLSADRIRYRGQDTYRVKLLTPSGRVRVVQLSDQATPEPEATDNQRKGED